MHCDLRLANPARARQPPSSSILIPAPDRPHRASRRRVDLERRRASYDIGRRGRSKPCCVRTKTYVSWTGRTVCLYGTFHHTSTAGRLRPGARISRWGDGCAKSAIRRSHGCEAYTLASGPQMCNPFYYVYHGCCCWGCCGCGCCGCCGCCVCCWGCGCCGCGCWSCCCWSCCCWSWSCCCWSCCWSCCCCWSC